MIQAGLNLRSNLLRFKRWLDPVPPGPVLIKETLSKVLFRHFEVLSILYAPSPLLPLFTLGTNTGLMLDCGHSEATLIPVYEGVPILRAWQAQPLGGQAVQASLRQTLQETATVKMKGGIEAKLKELEEEDQGRNKSQILI